MEDNKIRLLAAIMFTDMVGYTKLMQEDETKAKKLRDRHRKVLEHFIELNKGKILQYYGDGTLSMFGSALDSVKSAVSIQNELNKEHKIPLRIGIHVGDIVYEDEGIYGDGVNVASRIESLAEAGSILVSEKIYDEIKNHPEFPAEYLGEYELKNVKKPIELFALKNEGLTVPTEERLREKTGLRFKSIAVLPFVNMSPDPENEYFSDGISEEIINALTKVEGLQVTSRTSSFAFKNKQQDVREIGKQLNVYSVLEGSVRKFGNKVRITAQLINTGDGYHVFSETFDRDLEDIFSIQDEISKKIAVMLREKLSIKELKEPLVKYYTDNLEAYQKYLKGKYLFNRWNHEHTLEAMTCFKQAIELDRNFPLPYVMMANCYGFLGAIGKMETSEVYPIAQEYADKAVELDNNLPEAFSTLGLAALFFNWDFEKARKYFDKAVELNPNSAEVRQMRTIYFTALADFENAEKEGEIYNLLDPLSPSSNTLLGSIYYERKKIDKAIELLERTLELDPNSRSAMNELGWLYEDLGDNEKALEYFLMANENLGHELKSITFPGYIYAKSGKTEKALEIIEKLKKREVLEPGTNLDIDFAIVYSGLKDFDKVFEHLNKAVDKKVGGIIFIQSRNWNPIKHDPRYKEILERVGISSYKH